VNIQAKLDQALACDQPLHRLRDTVRGLLDQGHARAAIVDELERFRAVLRRAGREDDEDVVLEVMDFLVGWSSPHMKL
jgi:hypothetical protein